MDPNTFNQIQAQAEANYKAQQRTQPKAQVQQPQKKGRSGIAKWLPTALAVGGTLAAAPFTGGASLLGTAALLGGGAALGGGGGEFLAQKLSGEKTDLGKIAKEGAISGATGAIPIGGAAKAARVAGIATKAEQAAAKEAPTLAKGYQASTLGDIQNAGQSPYLTAFEKAHNAGDVKTAQAIAKKYPNDARVQIDSQPGLINRLRNSAGLHGQQMEARSGGYAVNAKLPGSNELDIAGSKGIDQVLQKEGVKPGSPLSRLSQVETKLAGHGAKIDEVLTKNNVKLDQVAKQNIADDYLKQIEKLPGVDDTIRNHANNIAQNFIRNGGNDVKGLVNFRRGLDQDMISYIANPDAATAGKQQAAQVARQALSSTTEKLAPAIKEPNQAYSKLMEAKGYLTKGTGEMNTKGGIVGRFAESGPVKTAESLLGRGAQKIAGTTTSEIAQNNTVPKGLLAKARSGFSKGGVIKEGVKQTIGGAALLPATDLTLGTDLSKGGQQPPQDPNAVDPNTPAPEVGAGSPTDVSTAPQDDSGDIQTQLDGAIKQALANGDTKGLDNLLKVADYYSAQQQAAAKAASSSSDVYGKISAQQHSLAQSGKQSLEQLSQLLSADPSLAKRNNTPGQGIPLIGNAVSNVAGVSDYHSLADNILSSLIHLQTGATATSEEITSAHGQLPGPNDSEEIKQRKIQTLLSNFEPFLSGNE